VTNRQPEARARARASRELLDAADRRARGQVQAIRGLADMAFTRSFRMHLQTCVKYLSPVAYDFVTAAGLGFDNVLNELRPGTRGSGCSRPGRSRGPLADPPATLTRSTITTLIGSRRRRLSPLYSRVLMVSHTPASG
jgi:hypothetical protein